MYDMPPSSAILRIYSPGGSYSGMLAI